VARPELMAYLGSITVMWAEIEAMLGVVFADMLGTEARFGVAVFLALRAEAAQKDVLRAVAELKLPGESATKFALFLKRLRDSAEARNRIAHGKWGYSLSHPDALVYMDPKDDLRHRSMRPVGQGRVVAEWMKKQPKLLLYCKDDFDLIEAQLSQLQTDLVHLWIEQDSVITAPPADPR
jgi:hypothetical protein